MSKLARSQIQVKLNLGPLAFPRKELFDESDDWLVSVRHEWSLRTSGVTYDIIYDNQIIKYDYELYKKKNI